MKVACEFCKKEFLPDNLGIHQRTTKNCLKIQEKTRLLSLNNTQTTLLEDSSDSEIHGVSPERRTVSPNGYSSNVDSEMKNDFEREREIFESIINDYKEQLDKKREEIEMMRDEMETLRGDVY